MFVSSVSKRCRKNYTHEKNLKMMNCWRLQLPSTWNLYLCDASLAVDWHKKTPWHTVFTWCSHLFTCLVSPGTRLVLYLTSRWRSPWCAWQWWGISPSYKGCHLTLTRVDLLLLTLIMSLCHICVVSHNNKTNLIWGAIRLLLSSFQQLAITHIPLIVYTECHSHIHPGDTRLSQVIRDLDREQCTSVMVWHVRENVWVTQSHSWGRIIRIADGKVCLNNNNTVYPSQHATFSELRVSNVSNVRLSVPSLYFRFGFVELTFVPFCPSLSLASLSLSFQFSSL